MPDSQRRGHLVSSPAMADTITPDEVHHVAKLARLRLSEEEADRFGRQLANVLDYVGQLRELEVEGVEEMAHPLDLINVLRDDQPTRPLDVEEALRNAPAREGRFYAVPKVLGDGGGA